ncbi:putative BRCT domain-containing protein [Seiridium cardinale]|uniref:BRCT domain-containing protein n=1 Tax=Seiridium cardinale TaxID=138064 RepID=A0ABR2Y700_9PEZI
MPPPPKPDIPKAAAPQFGSSFDPWNSSSTGHQRAENRLGGSTGWRDSRSAKLQSQFRGGVTGGKRMSDAVGAGSQDWDAGAQAIVPPGSRARARNSVMDMLNKPGTMNQTRPPISLPASAREDQGTPTAQGRVTAQQEIEVQSREDGKHEQKKLLDGVVVYVNGSTHPIISDHKLKHVLAKHGARMSTHLGRRQVTHVILGRPSGGRGGAGGGLAGAKLQREIQKVGGAAVKFVGVEWVLESIKAGKRLPEARFGTLKIAPKGQQSVFQMASNPTKTTSYPAPLTKQLQDTEPRSPTLPIDEPPPSAQRPLI